MKKCPSELATHSKTLVMGGSMEALDPGSSLRCGTQHRADTGLQVEPTIAPWRLLSDYIVWVGISLLMIPDEGSKCFGSSKPEAEGCTPISNRERSVRSVIVTLRLDGPVTRLQA